MATNRTVCEDCGMADWATKCPQCGTKICPECEANDRGECGKCAGVNEEYAYDDMNQS
jgi:hypothetical protein